MIPKWERKMEDERRVEEAARKRQQDEQIARIQAMADEMVAEARREVSLERDAKATVEFRLSQSFEAKARAKETSAEILEEEAQKFRLMLPALQATNTELTTTVQRLRERETERMQVAIEAEKSANQLRRELADATAAMQRADESREQLEGLLAASRLQCDRERREHAETLDRMTETQRRLEKECRALRISESGTTEDEYYLPCDGDGGNRLDDMFDTVELTLIKEVQAAKRMSVNYRVKLSECQQQLHKIAQEWGGTRTLLQQREQLITQLEGHLSHLAAVNPSSHSTAATTGPVDGLHDHVLQPAASSPATDGTQNGTGVHVGHGVAGIAEPAAVGNADDGPYVAGTSHAVLEVVSGQRDRLRARVQELEADVERLEEVAHEAKLAASKATKEQDALRQRLRYVTQSVLLSTLVVAGIVPRTEQVALVSPLLHDSMNFQSTLLFMIVANRYVQSAKTAAAASAAPSSALATSAGAPGGAAATDTMAPPAIDPFKEFARKEATQAENRLGTVERLSLDFARGFLSNPTGRRFLFFYFLILHVLTYMSILSHADHHQ